MAPEPRVLPFDEFPGVELHVWLFEDVSNAKDLRRRLVGGELPYSAALLDASAVPALAPVRLAARAALLAERRGALRTRALHSDLICNLSGSRHIGDSLRRFGAGEDSARILIAAIVRVGESGGGVDAGLGTRVSSAAELPALVAASISGAAVPAAELAGRLTAGADLAKVRKMYKIVPAEEEVGTVAEAIACRIACRDLP